MTAVAVGGALVNTLKNESCPNCFKFYRQLDIYDNKRNLKFGEKKMFRSALLGAPKVNLSISTSDSLMTHCFLANSLVLVTVSWCLLPYIVPHMIIYTLYDVFIKLVVYYLLFWSNDASFLSMIHARGW